MKKLTVELSHYITMPKQFIDPKSKYFKLTDKEKMVWLRLFDLWKNAHSQQKETISFRDKKGFAIGVLGISRQAFYKIFKTLTNLNLVKVFENELGYWEVEMFELEDEGLYCKPKKTPVKTAAKKEIEKIKTTKTTKTTKKTDDTKSTNMHDSTSGRTEAIIYASTHDDYNFIANGGWMDFDDPFDFATCLSRGVV